MDILGYSAHILVNGRKVKEYRHEGKTFVEAKDGTEFAIEVKNHISNRILAVISIDGLDIVDGKPANDKSRGYIIKGYNAETIHGWRKSQTEVGAFKFTTSEKSYATGQGKGQNNGVIAVRLVSEKQRYVSPIRNLGCVPISARKARKFYPTNSNQPEGFDSAASAARGFSLGGSTANAMASYSVQEGTPVSDQVYGLGFAQSSVPAEFDMGTTWGTKREDKVSEVEFEYGAVIATLEFFYASRPALQAMGVPLLNERQVPRLPQAFEGSNYAQPPKDWRA